MRCDAVVIGAGVNGLAAAVPLAAKRWKKLGMFYPSPGFMDERMWLYLAEDLSPAVAECDEDERITRKWFTREEFGRMVRKKAKVRLWRAETRNSKISCQGI